MSEKKYDQRRSLWLSSDVFSLLRCGSILLSLTPIGVVWVKWRELGSGERRRKGDRWISEEGWLWDAMPARPVIYTDIIITIGRQNKIIVCWEGLISVLCHVLPTTHSMSGWSAPMLGRIEMCARRGWKGLEGVGPDNLIWICIHLPLCACTNGNQLSFIRQIHLFLKFKLKQPASLWRQFSHSGVFLNVWLTAKL